MNPRDWTEQAYAAYCAAVEAWGFWSDEAGYARQNYLKARRRSQ